MTSQNPEERFQDFLRSFTSEDEYKYRKRLGHVALSGSRSLVVDFEDLIAYDPELARSILDKPDEYLEYLDRSGWAQLKIEDPEYAEIIKKLRIRCRKLPEKHSLRLIGSENIGRLLCIDGIIVRSTSVKPLLLKAAFQCRKCNAMSFIEQAGVLMRGPGVCAHCRSKVFEFLEKQSTFMNSQEIRIQERPEDLPPGQLPRAMDIKLSEDMVDIARPGDRVSITGTARAQQEYVGRKARLRTFDLQLDANYVDIVGKEVEVVEITPEDERHIRELAKDPFIHRKLIASLAPSIYGYGDIKEAVLYLLFGGVPKKLPDGVTIRSEINVLLVGDPGVAKSQLLQYVSRIAPRGLYTSGRGTTAAGLTAAVVREKSGGMVLEAGALVLADKGIACIDEMDKMRPEDRVAIHEALEQHSYHSQTEILLASGEKVKIGEFIDGLFRQHESEKMLGTECEILPLNGRGISLITTRDFRELSTTEVDRVSRHFAPKYFVEITYSHGRRVIVTPEHPVYVFRDGEIRTVPASEVRKNDFAPGPRELEPLLPPENLIVPTVSHHNEKTITLPSMLSEDLATILGYLITEGYSYKGSAAEIGFANTDSALFREMDSAMERTFHIRPLDYSQVNRTHRYISSRLYKYCSRNFPGLMHTARQKRLPAQLINAPANVVRAFLQSAFKGDGSVEPDALSFCTSSEGLAEDYQDLLLRLGIFSRLFRDKESYKAYVTGDSLRRFVELIVEEDDKRYSKAVALVERSKDQRGHDVVPTDACRSLISTQHLLGIRDDGYFWRHLKSRNGITRSVLKKRIGTLEDRLARLRQEIPEARSIRELRERLNWSQEKTATRLSLLRRTIDYAERGGYTAAKREGVLNALREHALSVFLQSENEIAALRTLLDLRWLKIRDVRTLKNAGPLRTRWVYDVTVEPTHNFVSHGVVLHNTVSVAKGGIVATLNARAAVLAAANPALGRYDPYRNINDNINLPVTLLSRFDLLFIMKDVPEADSDSRMSEHILTLHRLKTTPEEPPLLPEMLRKYIAYAKRIEPVLTDDSVNAIRQYYLKMRSLSGSSESPIVITPRQLEGLVRLAEARAKSFLRDRVEAEDAQAIIRLMTLSLQDVGIDSTTGKIDIDVIMTGKPKSLRDKMQVVLSTFADLEKQLGIVEDSTLYQALSRKVDLTDDEARRLIDQLVKEGILYSPKPGHLKRTAA